MNKSKKLGIMLVCLLMATAFATIASAQDELTEEEAAFLGLGLAVCAVVAIIWFIIFIAIAIWVYKDAEKRGSSGALWLILVILLGIIGIIIWLIVRPPIGGKPGQQPGTGRMCPNCGRPIPMDAQVCPYCGKQFGQP